MASGSLVLLQDETVSSPATSVDIGGTNWDTSYNVYKIIISGLVIGTDSNELRIRFLNSSNAAITSSEYDHSFKELKSDTTFGDGYGTNTDGGFLTSGSMGNATNEEFNGTLYLFNSNSSSEYTLYTMETSYLNASAKVRSNMGGGVLTSAEATKGIQLYVATGGSITITSANIKLYGLNK